MTKEMRFAEKYLGQVVTPLVIGKDGKIYSCPGKLISVKEGWVQVRHSCIFKGVYNKRYSSSIVVEYMDMK